MGHTFRCFYCFIFILFCTYNNNSGLWIYFFTSLNLMDFGSESCLFVLITTHLYKACWKRGFVYFFDINMILSDRETLFFY